MYFRTMASHANSSDGSCISKSKEEEEFLNQDDSARNESPVPPDREDTTNHDDSELFDDFNLTNYNMNHQHRGLCLIFNHEKFSDPKRLDPREGTKEDKEAMKNLFTDLGFKVKVYDDQKQSQIHDIIHKVRKMDHSANDCILLIFLTHGLEGGHIHAYDSAYDLQTTVFDKFKPENCPSLVGKPKMFFVQACRGRQIDRGYLIETDGWSDSSLTLKIPTMADFLVCYSTMPGYKSWRNDRDGAWFIQSIYKVFRKFHEEEDVLSLMTLVNNLVTKKYESYSKKFMEYCGNKQSGQINHSLRKKIYLRKS